MKSPTLCILCIKSEKHPIPHRIFTQNISYTKQIDFNQKLKKK